MEGIQHRWDCPNPQAEPKPLGERVEHPDGSTVTSVYCPGCLRAAIIHKPKETADDKR